VSTTTVDPGIAQALQVALAAGEVGVQVAAYVGEKLIVDAWAGEARPGVPVMGDTVFPILSAIKGLTATALHLQAERGLVEYGAPVAAYWPEFAAAGKEAVTVEDALCHRAGIPQMPPGSTLERMADWDWMTAAIAGLTPALPPGRANAYHAFTFGWLIGEIVRRTDPDRRPFGRFLQEEICGELGITSLWSGLPADAEHRCADVVAETYPGPPAELAPLRRAAVPSELGPPQVFQNLPAFRRACIPGGNGVANARSLARLYAMIANRGAIGDVRLVSAARLRWCAAPRPGFAERDHVTGDVSPVGRGGFQLGAPPAPAQSNAVVAGGAETLWHPGGGGTYGWADPEQRLAVAICHNRLVPGHAGTGETGRPVFADLADAVRAVAVAHARKIRFG
jgi:CubicO group peptidase (beta-lactamase class C family)